ncbi:hypothetical protein SAMN04488136_15614 [Vibrio xiamenensis]|uniref:Uncharacterized protein n=1 Tax=Vibrio xiamenensis TaxID=861298 RepID=A0A1G8HMS2_9VIBR|nr:hypothetical protein SAMN04488136_15614 [Vibrio xiamenensis]
MAMIDWVGAPKIRWDLPTSSKHAPTFGISGIRGSANYNYDTNTQVTDVKKPQYSDGDA